MDEVDSLHTLCVRHTFTAKDTRTSSFCEGLEREIVIKLFNCSDESLFLLSVFTIFNLLNPLSQAAVLAGMISRSCIVDGPIVGQCQL